MPQSGIVVANDVSFETENYVSILKHVSLSLNREKTGLVGKNGTGKTTLLKLLVGEFSPTLGRVERHGALAYLPQDYHFDLNATVREILGKVSGEWEMHEALAKAFSLDVDLDKKLGTLSGGERMKVALSKLFITNPDFVILDEPTNNLDRESRDAVYNFIKSWNKGLLVVSHDRALLGLMDQIAELTAKGLRVYGGDYDYYCEQKKVEDEALERDLVTAAQDFKKTKKQAQETQEKQARRAKRGKDLRAEGSIPKIALNTMRNKAEGTSSRLKKLHAELVEKAEEKLLHAKSQILPKNEISVDLSKTTVPAGKLLLELTHVSFSYDGVRDIISSFDLTLHGPARLALRGKNGSGKSTLVKLILGKLEPKEGSAVVGVERVAYLDQTVAVLNQDETLFENIKRIAKFDDHASRHWLGKFLFSDQAAFKKASVLSGGERMRAALACILAGELPPQLLILDEPTNNLDLDSIEQIESALQNFKGGLIVISHDETFLERVGVDMMRELG